MELINFMKHLLCLLAMLELNVPIYFFMRVVLIKIQYTTLFITLLCVNKVELKTRVNIYI